MENTDISSRHEIFCRYIRRNGRRIYPKNAKYFHFWVDDVPANSDPDSLQFSLFDNNRLN